MVTCPNNSCGKAFNKPLKTLNLKETTIEPYDACPFCLTKITDIEMEEEKGPKKLEAEAPVLKEKPNRDRDKPLSCQKYLGFLSEREQKAEIPEECMVCTQILECMLKKMNT